MDSVMEEDVTLPRTLSGCSGLVHALPDDLDGISTIPGLGNEVLPSVSEEKISPTRARNMKDFENQITELKKENFNLKLRIYFLEERMQQEFHGPTEHIYKTNIELKVEVESLKRELQERERLLVKASKAVESLAEGGGSEVQRVKEDARKKVQQVEDLLTKRIHLLEGDVKAAQAELEKAFVGTEAEKALRLSLESQLSALKKMQQGDLELALALEEKDRLIEELKLSLKSKESLIQCLKEEKSQMASPDENVSSGELRGLGAALREEQERDGKVAQQEHQRERSHFEERIQALQEDLREKEREIATEKKNSLKRDKAIQGLTMALKSKEKEVEELNIEIKELSAAFAKARESPQKAQASKPQVCEDHKAALAEKEALLAELRSENLTQCTENRRLLRNIKKINQELSDLQQEKLRLERDLEEAHREGSKGACTVQDLKNEVEKLCNELNEREKAMENHHKSLLDESSKKFHTQEQVITCLMESTNQKALMLQKFNEKDLEAIQQNRYLMTAEDLKFGSQDLITEKCSSQQPPGSKLIFSEEKQQSDYEELVQVLKKEQGIYAHLVKSLQDPDSVGDLQAELKDVLALRKQLERAVLTYQNLQKALQGQLSENQRHLEESFSFYSDQTSYLSICLEEHSQFQVEHFSQEELKKKVYDLIQLVKELYTDNQHLKKTIFELSCMGFQGNSRLESTKQIELPAGKEDEVTIKTEAEDESNQQKDQHLAQCDEIMEGHAKAGCKNGYLKNMESNILDCDGTHRSGCLGDQSLEGELLGLLASFFHEKATSSLESRPDLKAVGKLLLEHTRLAEQQLLGDHIDGETEKTLQQLAVQLGGELGHSVPADFFSKPHDELKSTGEAWLVNTGNKSVVELKDASVQTFAIENDPPRFRSGGQKEAWEEKPADTVVSTEPHLEGLCRMPALQVTPFSFPSMTSKDAKKSRLPILIKTSRSLQNMCHLPASQEVAQLQGQILELQGELKEFKAQNKQLHQKLILAEAMMEGMAVPEPALLNVSAAQCLVGAAYQDRPGGQKGPSTMISALTEKEVDSDHFEIDSEICSPGDLAILPTCRENPEEFLDPTSLATYLNSKSQLSVKVSMIETDQSENIDNSGTAEFLKQKIHDLQTELEGYRNFIFQLQKHSQCSEAIITVLCGTEGPQDGLNKGTAGEEEGTFSSLHQVQYVKHMKILCPSAPKLINSRMLESLTQQLVEEEQELQKEQNWNSELFSEIHSLQNKFRYLTPSRYDSLVQSQARELSLQRQQIKASHDICVTYHQRMSTMITAFYKLLQASDVDCCMTEAFQEQLNQCAGLLEQLEKLFLSGKSAGVELSPQNELTERLRTEEENLTYRHVLLESPEPSASHALSGDEMSEKSFLSEDQKQDSEPEKTSVVASHFPQDLLMEHIQEIRTLRKHLEESIKTNEKLRKQLERQGSEMDQGSTNITAYGSELHSSLMSEIQFLRKQNQALSTMLEKGSRDKQKENERLRESLSRQAANLEHLQQECDGVREENERLQRELSKKERHNQQLSQDVCSRRQELSRMQEEMKVRQLLLSQNDRLLQSLRVELKVYEKLDEQHTSQWPEAQGKVSVEGWKQQDSFSDLHGLVTEIQALRAQLERSIKANSTLRSKLEEQLAQGAKNAQEGALLLAVQAPSVPEWALQLDKHDGNKSPVSSDNSFDLFESHQATTLKPVSETPSLSRNDMASLSSDSSNSATSISSTPYLVADHYLWASKSGRHVLGLIEDYDALRRQIRQAQRLLAELDIQTQEALTAESRDLKTEGPHSSPLSKFVSSVSMAKLILEEASRLLQLLWRASVPTGGQCPLHCEQIGEMKVELTRLHRKLFEQEKKLQNTAKLLQQSKHQERVIFDQLVITHQVLRKARGNLELRPGGAHPGTSSPSRPGS